MNETASSGMPLREIHEKLQRAFDDLSSVRDNADRCGPDTAFAIGEALGDIAKAKAPVGRDIDATGS